MILTERRYTADEWVTLPDDGQRYELVDGALVALSPATIDHAEVRKMLQRLLLHAEDAGYGECFGPTLGVILDPQDARRNARLPDLLFVRTEHLSSVAAAALEGSPDLLIEVRDDDAPLDELPGGRKFADYERFGVPAYWVADVATRTVSQYTLAGGRYEGPTVLHGQDRLTSSLFPGIAVPVDVLFSKVRQPAWR